MADEHVLDISTLIVRPHIKIDGKNYEILSVNELSVVETQRFALWGTELQQLISDKSKEAELEALVTDLARRILVGVPDSVFEKLKGGHKFSVVEAFTMLLLTKKAETAGAIAKNLGLATGGVSFPGSNASTAASPAGGSSKHQ